MLFDGDKGQGEDRRKQFTDDYRRVSKERMELFRNRKRRPVKSSQERRVTVFWKIAAAALFVAVIAFCVWKQI
jgi:hypothetical protein